MRRLLLAAMGGTKSLQKLTTACVCPGGDIQDVVLLW